MLAYIDSNVLITAARMYGGGVEDQEIAFLNNPALRIATSVFVQMEVFPAAIHNRRKAEEQWYEEYFRSAHRWADRLDRITELALRECSKVHGLAPMDSLHLAAAASVNADVFVTLEGRNKPIYRTSLVKVQHLDG